MDISLFYSLIKHMAQYDIYLSVSVMPQYKTCATSMDFLCRNASP
jgi:hypothetical protein